MPTRRTRIRYILDYFEKTQAPASTELQYSTPFELLVSVILSAQCTDQRVNATTPALFEAFPRADEMAKASFETLFPYIKSISYPNNKTRHLLAMSRLLVEKHKGEVPDEIPALRSLAGVGRKTAHVVAAELFEAEVLAVDTHVFRVAHRLRLVPTQARTPLAVEESLTQSIPTAYLRRAHHWLILHGRYICTARKPKCGSCELQQICPSADHYLK